jgi:hypothetical protein
MTGSDSPKINAVAPLLQRRKFLDTAPFAINASLNYVPIQQNLHNPVKIRHLKNCKIIATQVNQKIISSCLGDVLIEYAARHTILDCLFEK